MVFPGAVLIPVVTAVVATSGFAAAQPVIGVIAGLLTIISLVGAALWALHRALSRVERLLGTELRHNDGGSMKDIVHENSTSLTNITHQISEATSTALIATTAAQLSAVAAADRAEQAAERLTAIVRLLEDRTQEPAA